MTVSALAIPMDDGHEKETEPAAETVCERHQTVMCSGNGNGLLSLGILAIGFLSEGCSGGDVYCSSQ